MTLYSTTIVTAVDVNGVTRLISLSTALDDRYHKQGGKVRDYAFIPASAFVDGAVPPAALAAITDTNAANVRAFAAAADNDVFLNWQPPPDINPAALVKFRVIITSRWLVSWGWS